MHFPAVDDTDSIGQPPSSVSGTHVQEEAGPSTRIAADITNKVSIQIPERSRAFVTERNFQRPNEENNHLHSEIPDISAQESVEEVTKTRPRSAGGSRDMPNFKPDANFPTTDELLGLVPPLTARNSGAQEISDERGVPPNTEKLNGNQGDLGSTSSETASTLEVHPTTSTETNIDNSRSSNLWRAVEPLNAWVSLLNISI